MKTIIHRSSLLFCTLYPPECLLCRAPTITKGGLCSSCRADITFFSSNSCRYCGQSIYGNTQAPTDENLSDIPFQYCEDCYHFALPWHQGASVMPYSGSGRKIVLKLKHGDRLDMVMPLARWMSTIGKHLIAQSDLLIPVPLHRIRLFQRRYNQSAELSRAIAQITGKKTLMDALIRTEYSELKKHKNREERIQNIQNAFTTHKPRSSLITGKNILLIDDVMTTGATLSACTRACNASGARTVRILVLCRTISNKTACIP